MSFASSSESATEIFRPQVGALPLPLHRVNGEKPRDIDNISALIRRGKAWAAINNIFQLMSDKRASMTRDAWKHYVENEVRGSSDIKAFAHACPFTQRCVARPRGYAGDAVMMDYIYGIASDITPSQLDSGAEEVYRYTTNAPASRAVRYRRKLLARYIDAACLANPGTANILAIACGHFREAELSLEIPKHNFASIVALDQDEHSLATVTSHYARHGITPMRGSVKNLIVGKNKFPAEYDLVYSAGLYDYLEAPIAKRLTENLFASLRSKGTLLLANFLPDIPDVGYMECLMDWWLIYRSDAEMLALISGIDANNIAHYKIFRDPEENIVFLEVTRR